MEIIRMLLMGAGMAGAFGGPYILYLAFFKPSVFPKPGRAKWEGAISTVMGVILFLLAYFQPWQR